MSAEQAAPTIDAFYSALMLHARSKGANTRFIASMLASWYAGLGGMPARMGLGPAEFDAMLASFFYPGVRLPPEPVHDEAWIEQMPEIGELTGLFEEFAADELPERGWIAAMLIAGCSGRRHLWEDLGLFSRADLTAMIRENFPKLAEANSRDMKWKKFIYKQLCERSGIYACPAPTCDACADFSICFASEEEPSGL